MSNLRYALDQMGYTPGEKLVSILTMAHMYGLAFEFIYPFASGIHIYFLQKMPSPKILGEVFADIRPHLIVAVPLIIEKIIKSRVLPQLEKFHIKLMLKMPIIGEKSATRSSGRFLMLSGDDSSYSQSGEPPSIKKSRHSSIP